MGSDLRGIMEHNGTPPRNTGRVPVEPRLASMEGAPIIQACLLGSYLLPGLWVLFHCRKTAALRIVRELAQQPTRLLLLSLCEG